MKKFFIAAVLVLLFVKGSFSQQMKQGEVLISTSKLALPLVEKWISAFNTEYPGITVLIAPKGFTGRASLYVNADLNQREGFQSIAVNRFVLLPIANAHNVYLKDYFDKGVKEKEITKLFFSKYDPYATAEQTNKERKKLPEELKKVNLYTSLQKGELSNVFSSYYGFEAKDILGKHISGDEKFLVSAVQKDSNGVAYNHLGNIYDLQTRKTKSGIAVIPLDLNENGMLEENEKMYESLDKFIETRHALKDKSFPEGFVKIYFPKNTDPQSATAQFKDWLLANASKYNQELGFLDVEEERQDPK